MKKQLVCPLVELIEANDVSGISPHLQDLGRQLVAAFHTKAYVENLRQLVNNGAPVNWRLDYGLEVRLEADFVAAFKLLLEGPQGRQKLVENARMLVGDEHAEQLAEYVFTADTIFDMLYRPENNVQNIGVNPQFIEHLKKYAVSIRANPEQQNGSLIVAAGLRSVSLIQDIITIGKKATEEQENNGAEVNFRGYFGDTAAVWSAILLDVDSLEVLLQHGATLHNIGITGSSLLHWVAVAAQLDRSSEREQHAQKAIECLMRYGASPYEKNKLGKTPLDYASNSLKLFLIEQYKAQMWISPCLFSCIGY